MYDFACTALERSSGSTPTKRESLLVEHLIKCSKSRTPDKKLQRAVRVLTASAFRWKNLDILLRTLKGCQVEHNTDLLGSEGFVLAYKEFGWDAVKDL
jgi:hypothetical protein